MTLPRSWYMYHETDIFNGSILKPGRHVGVEETLLWQFLLFHMCKMIKYMYCWNLAAKLQGNLSPMVLAINVNSQFSTSVLGCWWNLTKPLQLTPRGYFIHDRAEIQNISSSVEKYFTRSSIIQHERRNFASPSSHEIMCDGKCHAFARKPIWYFTGVYAIYKSCTHIIFFLMNCTCSSSTVIH